MASGVLDVAGVLLSRLGPMESNKLHRLVYSTHAWHVTWLNRPLFLEPIEAWGRGPTVRELFRASGGRFSLRSIGGDADIELEPDSRGVIGFVTNEYGPLRGQRLAATTRAHDPCLEVFVRGANEPITYSSMSNFSSTDRRLMGVRSFRTGSVHRHVVPLPDPANGFEVHEPPTGDVGRHRNSE